MPFRAVLVFDCKDLFRFVLLDSSVGIHIPRQLERFGIFPFLFSRTYFHRIVNHFCCQGGFLHLRQF